MKINLGVDYQDIADSDEAAQIGRSMGVSYVLTGLIEERGDSMEIYANLIDTASGNIITNIDVYDEHIKLMNGGGHATNFARAMDKVAGRPAIA